MVREEAMLSDELFGTISAAKSDKSEKRTKKVKAVDEESEGIGIVVDRDGSKGASKGDKKEAAAEKAAWNDDDDEDLVVDLKSTDRLRKLQKPNSEGEVLEKDSKVTGAELSSYLQERFQTQKLDWATVTEDDKDEGMALLRKTGTMVNKKGGKGKSNRTPLPSGRIDISRLIDANAAEPSKSAITTVKFHNDTSNGTLLMTGGNDRFLRFFRVDGDKNEKTLSVRFNDMPISCATFLGNSSQVVIGGRKPFFYSYDCESGKVTKVPGLMGRGLKSHENMIVSPEGSRIAFLGAGGYVHVACGKNKTWQCDVKMNTAARAATFEDENTLITSGLDADVYKWDLRMNGRCLSRFKHEDGTCTSSLRSIKAPNSSTSYLAVGSESGVMTLYDGNISAGTSPPKIHQTALNLTTKISNAVFHPSSQILAFSSGDVNDQLRFMHMPSYTIFENWPTEKTPLRKVQCLDFSPGGAYLAAGNDRGRVLLYKLKHFNEF